MIPSDSSAYMANWSSYHLVSAGGGGGFELPVDLRPSAAPRLDRMELCLALLKAGRAACSSCCPDKVLTKGLL